MNCNKTRGGGRMKGTKFYLTLFLCSLLLAGCGPGDPFEASKIDQCMRAKLFQSCMASLPKGPDETVYNDWDEVVGKCSNVARQQSIRLQSNVKPECRAQ